MRSHFECDSASLCKVLAACPSREVHVAQTLPCSRSGLNTPASILSAKDWRATALATNSKMPGRRIRVPNIYNVHIPVELAAHSEVAHSLLVALIKHLSYAREQCHAPYTQLEVHAKASAVARGCLTAASLRLSHCKDHLYDLSPAGLQAATTAAVGAEGAAKAPPACCSQGCQGNCMLPFPQLLRPRTGVAEADAWPLSGTFCSCHHYHSLFACQSPCVADRLWLTSPPLPLTLPAVL